MSYEGNIADLHFNLMSFLMTYAPLHMQPQLHLPMSCSLSDISVLDSTCLNLTCRNQSIFFNQSINQSSQKSVHDLHGRSREFFVGQRVLARNFRDGHWWLPGTVVERREPTTQCLGLSSTCHISAFHHATTSLQ